MNDSERVNEANELRADLNMKEAPRTAATILSAGPDRRQPIPEKQTPIE